MPDPVSSFLTVSRARGARRAPGGAGQLHAEAGHRVLMINRAAPVGRAGCEAPAETLAWARPLRLSAFGAQRATARP